MSTGAGAAKAGAGHTRAQATAAGSGGSSGGTSKVPASAGRTGHSRLSGTVTAHRAPAPVGGQVATGTRFPAGVQGLGFQAGSGAKIPVPVTTVPFGERAGGTGIISPNALWSGGLLQVGTILRVPLTLGGLAVVFVVAQWFIDRRDPKVVDAPAREAEDSVGFD